MSIKQYTKLVRDRIPEIIEASGKNCVTEILSDADYLKMLDAKLDEELAEYHKDQTVEELADLLEVIFAAATARGCELEQLEHIRREKARKRGTFEKKILLKKVIDPSGDENIVSKIVRNQSAILEKLDEKVLSSYFWLMDNLHTRNIAADEEYRRRFGGYYRMRFVSEKYRDAFFELFEQIKEQPEFFLLRGCLPAV
jgi:predicted house-cleaning noncanonical NTP pyrophosphatase (MazG superfamily)